MRTALKTTILVIVILFGSLAYAQNTITVSLSVTDTGSQTWNNGTWSTAFNGPSSTLCPGGAITPQNGTLSSTGTASIVLLNNATCLPSGTTWFFTVCPQSGVSSGCFTQSLPAAANVSLAPPAIVVSVPLTPTTITPKGAYADSEISGGWPGFTYYNVSIPAMRTCTGVSGSSCSSWTASGGNNLGTWTFSSSCASSNCTKVNADAVVLTDCTTANTSSTITCPDGLFRASDVGKTVWATTLGTSNQLQINATMVCPQTTIATVNSSTSITVAAANDCTSTQTGTAALFYGTKDGTTIKNAMNAQCANFVFQAGPGPGSAQPGTVNRMLIDQPFGNTVASPCNAPYITISGGSPTTSSSVFALTPDFNWAGCTGNNGKISNVCFGAAAINMSYLSFAGYGLNGTGACPAAAQAKTVVGPSSIVNQSWALNLNGICPGTLNLVGIELDSLDGGLLYGGAIHVGTMSGVINAPAVSGVGNDFLNDGATVTGNACASDSLGFCSGLWIKVGAVYQDFSEWALENVFVGGTLEAHGSNFFSSANQWAITAAAVGSTARVNSDGDFINPPNIGADATLSGGILMDRGAIAYFRNTSINAGTAVNNINMANDGAANTFFDECGNTYTGATTPLNIQGAGAAGQVISEACSANLTLVTAAKTVLSAGWGSTAAVTALSGSNAPIQFTITNSGTGQAASPTITYTFPTPYLVSPFTCTATQTGGTNASLNPFASSALTKTGVTFTATGTPTASSTEIMQVTCVTP